MQKWAKNIYELIIRWRHVFVLPYTHSYISCLFYPIIYYIIYIIKLVQKAREKQMKGNKSTQKVIILSKNSFEFLLRITSPNTWMIRRAILSHHTHTHTHTHTHRQSEDLVQNIITLFKLKKKEGISLEESQKSVSCGMDKRGCFFAYSCTSKGCPEWKSAGCNCGTLN